MAISLYSTFVILSAFILNIEINKALYLIVGLLFLYVGLAHSKKDFIWRNWILYLMAFLNVSILLLLYAAGRY